MLKYQPIFPPHYSVDLLDNYLWWNIQHSTIDPKETQK